ncbi:MAG: S1 RNA-binding domain-containing protein [Clostridiales bacterium]|nr:S1 RNA-binding domain-containing protein [Clostridiales bacterium]MCF8022650.1 S1 RNA-binding domain-containing protein [Clostridiales bacterium]
MTQKEFFQDVWPEIFSSRQNRTVIWWPVTGIEEWPMQDGKKMPCLVVTRERVKGIIPLKEIGIKVDTKKPVNRRRMMKLLGQDIAMIVIGIDREQDVFMASRKAALEQLKTRTWPNLKEGQVVNAAARHVYPTNVIVEFGGVEANLPVWELSHGWVDDIGDMIQPGDEFQVKIKELDSEKEKVTVSVKDLLPNPWPEALERYKKKSIYQGRVTGTTSYGAFVELEPGVNALCRHMRSQKYEVKKGDIVAVQVTNIIAEEQKINGSLLKLIRKTESA